MIPANSKLQSLLGFGALVHCWNFRKVEERKKDSGAHLNVSSQLSISWVQSLLIEEGIEAHGLG